MFFSSCVTTKTNIGAYRETKGDEYTYANEKQIWLFWCTIPLGKNQIDIPMNGNCQVITRFNLMDILISGITGGVVTTYSVKVKARK